MIDNPSNEEEAAYAKEWNYRTPVGRCASFAYLLCPPDQISMIAWVYDPSLPSLTPQTECLLLGSERYSMLT